MEMKIKASQQIPHVFDGWVNIKKKIKKFESSRVQILRDVRLLVFVVSGVVFKQFRQIKSEN